jgi:hypothetical protein
MHKIIYSENLKGTDHLEGTREDDIKVKVVPVL